MADFSSVGEIRSSNPVQEKSPSKDEKTIARRSKQSTIPESRPSLHINIQIHISPDSSPEQIDQIFESMSKHLRDL